MYLSIASEEDKCLVGRPKRDDRTERANLKLNSEIRKVLKISATMDGRSESAQVERLVIESEALKRFLKKNPDIASNVLPGLHEEIASLLQEIVDND
ncbi:hypothetical protein VB735_15165 [Halotia wernerae UHCC 0503]|nr:hypothetical protein [Halotia wernerae UHCC 0503]